MKSLLKIIFVVLLVIFPFSFISAHAEKHILFIGNSLTYANDLPQLIANLAKFRHHHISYLMYAPNSYKLIQHANDPHLLAIIKKGHWDWVVIQEQSQMPEFPQWYLEENVYPYAAQIAETVRTYSPRAQLAFFQTMANEYGDPINIPVNPELGTYEGAQERINASYIEMANRNQAKVVPVGYLYKRIRHERPLINLYANYVHPNLTGSYLAACIFYAVIFQDNTAGLPYPEQVKPETANYFHRLIDNIRQSPMDQKVRNQHSDQQSLDKWLADCYQKIKVLVENQIVRFANAFEGLQHQTEEWYQAQQESLLRQKDTPKSLGVNVFLNHGHLEAPYKSTPTSITPAIYQQPASTFYLSIQ